MDAVLPQDISAMLFGVPPAPAGTSAAEATAAALDAVIAAGRQAEAYAAHDLTLILACRAAAARRAAGETPSPDMVSFGQQVADRSRMMFVPTPPPVAARLETVTAQAAPTGPPDPELQHLYADFSTALGIAFEARINPFTDNLLRNLPPPGYFDSEEGQAFINQHS